MKSNLIKIRESDFIEVKEITGQFSIKEVKDIKLCFLSDYERRKGKIIEISGLLEYCNIRYLL